MCREFGHSSHSWTTVTERESCASRGDRPQPVAMPQAAEAISGNSYSAPADCSA